MLLQCLQEVQVTKNFWRDRSVGATMLWGKTNKQQKQTNDQTQILTEAGKEELEEEENEGKNVKAFIV